MSNASYEKAGVSLEAGYKSVELMKGSIAKTLTKGALSMIGGFGGSFELDVKDMKNPVLVSGTDGVGTKLKAAFLLDKHDTVGIDLVAMCVNDIICCGAKPLFFLDYIATGKNVPEKIAQIVGGVSEGCIQSGASIVGGETAEMPGFYNENEYDLAGFAVGVVDKEKMIDSSNVKEGDVIIALPSSGIHSNGFSLIRNVFDLEKDGMKTYEELGNSKLLEVLLTPTKIYVKNVLKVLNEVKVKSISHITGGGFYENIPRALPKGLSAKIKKSDVKILPIFSLIQKEGNISEKDMFNTFNMGVGMTLIVDKADVSTVLNLVDDSYVLGEIVNDSQGVILW